MSKRTSIVAFVFLLVAGAGCQKCVEPTEQEKLNQDPAPFATFKGHVGKTSVGKVLGEDAGGAKAAAGVEGGAP
jgi:hypothetical protein